VSDNPLELKAILLDNATTAEQQAFAKMLAEQCAVAEDQRSGVDWSFILSPTEYERMKKYWRNEKCPKCGKGRLRLEFYHGNIGDSIHIKCAWGTPECDFSEYISDDE